MTYTEYIGFCRASITGICTQGICIHLEAQVNIHCFPWVGLFYKIIIMKTILSVCKLYGHGRCKNKVMVEANGKTVQVHVVFSEKIEVRPFLNRRSIGKVTEQVELLHTDFSSENWFNHLQLLKLSICYTTCA